MSPGIPPSPAARSHLLYPCPFPPCCQRPSPLAGRLLCPTPEKEPGSLRRWGFALFPCPTTFLYFPTVSPGRGGGLLPPAAPGLGLRYQLISLP